MPETPPDPADLLAAVVNDRSAFVAVEGLAPGADLDATVEVLSGLVAAGLLDWWTHPDAGLGVCLSAVAAERLGLELDPTGHWVPTGTAEFRKHQSRRVALESELSGPDDPFSLVEMPDPSSPDPLASAIASEIIERTAPKKRNRADHAPEPPKPTLLLGSGALWRGPTPDGEVCPVCRGRRIPAMAYCLKCDAFGLNHLLPRVVTPPSDKPPPKFRPKIKASAHAHPLT